MRLNTMGNLVVVTWGCHGSWTGSCVDIYAERSGTRRQSKTCEEAGLYCGSRFRGFDVGEGEEIICKCHCSWYVHASTQWKAKAT